MNNRECDGEDCEIRGAHVGRTRLAVPRETQEKMIFWGRGRIGEDKTLFFFRCPTARSLSEEPLFLHYLFGL